MNDRYRKHLADMKTRHTAELEALARALAGRRPGLLRDLRKHHMTLELETAKIFKEIDRREGSHEGS